MKTILAWIVPYFVMTSGLFLIGYWSTFNIDIFQYIEFTEIIQSFVYPFLSTAVFIFLGIIFGEVIFDFDNNLKPGEGKQTTLGKFLNKYIRLLLFLYLALITL